MLNFLLLLSSLLFSSELDRLSENCHHLSRKLSRQDSRQYKKQDIFFATQPTASQNNVETTDAYFKQLLKLDRDQRKATSAFITHVEDKGIVSALRSFGNHKLERGRLAGKISVHPLGKGNGLRIIIDRTPNGIQVIGVTGHHDYSKFEHAQRSSPPRLPAVPTR